MAQDTAVGIVHTVVNLRGTEGPKFFELVKITCVLDEVYRMTLCIVIEMVLKVRRSSIQEIRKIIEISVMVWVLIPRVNYWHIIFNI